LPPLARISELSPRCRRETRLALLANPRRSEWRIFAAQLSLADWAKVSKAAIDRAMTEDRAL
jgi:hypothetical protein